MLPVIDGFKSALLRACERLRRAKRGQLQRHAGVDPPHVILPTARVQRKLTSSTSKIRVALGGIGGGYPALRRRGGESAHLLASSPRDWPSRTHRGRRSRNQGCTSAWHAARGDVGDVRYRAHVAALRCMCPQQPTDRRTCPMLSCATPSSQPWKSSGMRRAARSERRCGRSNASGSVP